MCASFANRWTAEEDEIVKRYYPIEGPQPLVARLPKRSLQAIKGRAYDLGLLFVEKWTEEEYRVLREEFSTRGQAWVAMKLGRSRSCVKTMAQRLGIEGRSDWRTKIKTDNASYRGYQGLSGTRWGVIRSGAIRRNLDFDITMEYAWEIYERQGGKCALSGVPIPFASNRATNDGVASLDRIDSSEGYVKGNIQWLHESVNRMKWDLPQSEFIDYCHRVAALYPKIP